ncbi:hypothetical protein DFP73DRAFT_568040 [Morchella snyderi]|nr:hypothetical protein DFP73DRAFT_568040 [Morchella snyderi]
MKFSLTALLLLAASGATIASAPVEREYTSYVVTYNPDTPDSVVDQDIAKAKENGAIITHRYHIIKGYSVDSPDGMDALNFVHADDYANKQYQPTIEEDQVVTTQHSRKPRSG